MQNLGYRDHPVKAPDQLGRPARGQARRLDVDHQLVLIGFEARAVAALGDHAEQAEHLEHAEQSRRIGGGKDGKAVNPLRVLGRHGDDPLRRRRQGEPQLPDPEAGSGD
jgi:hypothetical protein